MQRTHFQIWQMEKKSWRVVTNFLYFLRTIVRRHDNLSASYSFHPAQNGKIFQHRLIYFIHTNTMNPFSKLTNGEKAMKNRYKFFMLFAKNTASPWQLFSVIFIPSGSERKDFSTQTNWFYSYQCNEPIFKVDNWGKSHELSLRTFNTFAINCASPWQPFSVIFIQSGSEQKDFSTQTDTFYSYQCNVPIFKVDKMGKSLEKSLQNFYSFAKNCAWPWQLFSVIFIPSGSEWKDFSTQTDLFYSYQCNEPIFKVDNWGKSHEKSLQTFNTFWKNRASPWQLFCVTFIPSGTEGKAFQHKLIHFIHNNAMYPFLKLTKLGKSHEKSLQTFYSFAINSSSPNYNF